jgi:uncharacterized protein YbcI
MPMDSRDPQSGSKSGALVSDLSREIVRLHARLYGRGPTKARSYLQGDFVLCVLEDLFTPSERTLIDAGDAGHVVLTRAKFQAAVREEFISTVERITGRKVRTFMSQTDIETDCAVEFFTFADASQAPAEPA